MRVHLAILHAAALLVPRQQREEWLAEWHAESWYIRKAGKPALAFCLGAFKDAWWLRRNHPPSFAILSLKSPSVCLAALAALATVSIFATWDSVDRQRLVRPPDPDARNLMLISHYRRPISTYPTVRLAEYQSWTGHEQRLFSSLAFYQRCFEHMHVPGHRTANIEIARASENLFDLLHVSLPGQDSGVRLVLSQAAWQKFFDRDPHVAGRIVEVAGLLAVVGGVLPESAANLPLRVDAWLLEDAQHLSMLPPDSAGFVLARANRSSLRSMRVPNAAGGQDYFDCVPMSDRASGPAAGFLTIVLMSGFLLPAITTVSLGEYPSNGLRRWLFLAAKSGLVLAMVYCWACYVACTGGPIHGLLVGCVMAFRWVLTDQRQRCPVCLRRLSNPVRIGQPSQTFLEWYGTEFMCAKGHGLLHVTELPTSCYGAQRWLQLDRSWGDLFTASPVSSK